MNRMDVTEKIVAAKISKGLNWADDGIMSAFDFRMELTREADPKGDRVRILLSGKFLPYKTY